MNTRAALHPRGSLWSAPRSAYAAATAGRTASPGRRQTLPELVQDFLERRLLPGEIDRAAFVQAGVELVAAVEREWAEG